MNAILNFVNNLIQNPVQTVVRAVTQFISNPVGTVLGVIRDIASPQSGGSSATGGGNSSSGGSGSSSRSDSGGDDADQRGADEARRREARERAEEAQRAREEHFDHDISQQVEGNSGNIWTQSARDNSEQSGLSDNPNETVIFSDLDFWIDFVGLPISISLLALVGNERYLIPAFTRVGLQLPQTLQILLAGSTDIDSEDNSINATFDWVRRCYSTLLENNTTGDDFLSGTEQVSVSEPLQEADFGDLSGDDHLSVSIDDNDSYLEYYFYIIPDQFIESLSIHVAEMALLSLAILPLAVVGAAGAGVAAAAIGLGSTILVGVQLGMRGYNALSYLSNGQPEQARTEFGKLGSDFILSVGTAAVATVVGGFAGIVRAVNYIPSTVAYSVRNATANLVGSTLVSSLIDISSALMPERDPILAEINQGLEASRQYEQFGTQTAAENAIMHFTSVLEIDPDNRDALRNRANIYIRRLDNQGAISDLERLLSSGQSDVVDYRSLALLYASEGDTTHAIQIVRDAQRRFGADNHPELERLIGSFEHGATNPILME